MTVPTNQSSTAPVPNAPDRRQELARKLDQSLDGSDAAALALRFAALSAQFDPNDALVAAGFAGTTPDLSPYTTLKRLAVISQLADVCETRLSASRWSMRSAPRSRLLGRKVATSRASLPGGDGRSRLTMRRAISATPF